VRINPASTNYKRQRGLIPLVRIESNVRFSKHQVMRGWKSAASSPGWCMERALKASNKTLNAKEEPPLRRGCCENSKIGALSEYFVPRLALERSKPG
jgi:hypothetical protein